MLTNAISGLEDARDFPNMPQDVFRLRAITVVASQRETTRANHNTIGRRDKCEIQSATRLRFRLLCLWEIGPISNVEMRYYDRVGIQHAIGFSLTMTVAWFLNSSRRSGTKIRRYAQPMN